MVAKLVPVVEVTMFGMNVGLNLAKSILKASKKALGRFCMVASSTHNVLGPL